MGDTGHGRKQRNQEKSRPNEPMQVPKKDRGKQLEPISGRTKTRRQMAAAVTNRRADQSMMSQTSRDHYIGKVEHERKVIDSHIQKIKSTRPIEVPKKTQRQQASELRKKQEVIGCYDAMQQSHHQILMPQQSPPRKKNHKRKRSPRPTLNGDSEKLYEVPLAVMLR